MSFGPYIDDRRSEMAPDIEDGSNDMTPRGSASVSMALRVILARTPEVDRATVKAEAIASWDLKLRCRLCGERVAHGINGEVSEPPPWNDKVEVLCYGCDNALAETADAQHVQDNLEAADRAAADRVGQGDLA